MKESKESKRQDAPENDLFKRCSDFHGHVCPGLAMGFQAAQILMSRLGVLRAKDEELVAIVETDACVCDAIQVLTGCTYGKGNLVFKNYGKHAFSLIDRKKDKAIRVCLRPGAMRPGPEYLSLSEKVRDDEASEIEIERFEELRQEQVRTILDMDPESLFEIVEITPEVIARARIMESGICDFCGETTKIDLLRKVNGKKVCIPCAERRGFGDIF